MRAPQGRATEAPARGRGWDTSRTHVTTTVHRARLLLLLCVCMYGVKMMHPGPPQSCVMHCKPFLVTISTPGASPAHVCVMTGCLSMARAH